MTRFRAAVFDWAGTIVDFGSRAPVESFMGVFEEAGMPVSESEARAPMGLPKRDHIAAMLAMPRIAGVAAQIHGRPAGEAEIDALHARFEPVNAAAAARRAALVPGALEVFAALRARGMAIGTTTGYSRAIMAHVLPVAEAQGFVPDCTVCSGDLPEGRPGPMMMRHVMAELGTPDPASVVKIDDTAPGIAEGLAAGTLTVGVALSGNEVGLEAEAVAALSPDQRAEHRARATARLVEAGAHHVIDTVADLPALLDRLEASAA